MSYVPAPVPSDPQLLAEFLRRELQRISADLGNMVQYRTLPANASLSAGISANWKAVAAGNVIRLSTSSTVTLTGLALTQANRELVLVNVGTGVVVLLSESAASSASYRFALAATYQLSANASVSCWYDAQRARWRGIGRT